MVNLSMRLEEEVNFLCFFTHEKRETVNGMDVVTLQKWELNPYNARKEMTRVDIIMLNLHVQR